MATFNESLFDDAVRHQVNLQRLSRGEANKILRMLEESDKELRKLIAERAGSLSADDFTTARWKAMRTEIARTRTSVIKSIGDELGDVLEDLAVLEQDIAKVALQKAVPVEINFATTSPTTLRAMAQNKPFGGADAMRTLTEWMVNLEEADQNRIRGALQAGVAQGETIPQITNRVQQATDLTKRNAEAIARTGVNHISNSAREEFFKENDDVILALRWTSTLDGRTSAICRARDGHFSPVEGSEGKDVPSPKISGTPQRPPAHLNCRSLMVAVLDADAVADEMPERPFVKDARTRRKREIDFRKQAKDRAGKDEWKSMSREERRDAIRDIRRDWTRENVGTVPGDTTYDDWLRRQDAEFQDEVLGPTKGKLFREGRTMDQFVDRQGNELTIDELEQKAPPASKQSAQEREVRKARDVDAKAKRAEENAKKARQREAEAKKRAEAEETRAKELREEQAKQKEEARAEAKRRKDERAAAKKKQAEEKAAKDKARKEAAKKKREEAARKKRERAEAVRKKKEAAAAKKKKRDEAAAKRAAAKKKKADEAAARKKKADEAAKKKREEAARKKKEREEAARKKKAEAAKKKAEADAKKKAADEAKVERERKAKQAEVEAKKKRAAAEVEKDFPDLEEAPISDEPIDGTTFDGKHQQGKRDWAARRERRKASWRKKAEADTLNPKPVTAEMRKRALKDPQDYGSTLTPRQQNEIYGVEHATLLRRLDPRMRHLILAPDGKGLRNLDDLVDDWPRDIPQKGMKWTPAQQDKWSHSISLKEQAAIDEWAGNQDVIQELQMMTPAQRAKLPRRRFANGDVTVEVKVTFPDGSQAIKGVSEDILETWEGALKKAPVYDGEVWRGIGVTRAQLDDMIDSGTIRLLDDQSASVLSSKAWDFGRTYGINEGKETVMFRVLKQKNGKMIMDHALTGEAEVVLRQGSQYRIVNVVESQPGITILEMEEI